MHQQDYQHQFIMDDRNFKKESRNHIFNKLRNLYVVIGDSVSVNIVVQNLLDFQNHLIP